uniref:Uncharacterized protein n=1 Tax=Arundo donax TaxID=35708 RepID=A0A0A9DFC2_ARUDO
MSSSSLLSANSSTMPGTWFSLSSSCAKETSKAASFRTICASSPSPSPCPSVSSSSSTRSPHLELTSASACA